MLRLCFKLPFRLFGHTSDRSVTYEKAKCVCFIYMQPKKVEITSVQINMKQVSYTQKNNSRILRFKYISKIQSSAN